MSENGLGSFQPYSAYKDSGLEWQSIMPASWDKQRAKFIFDRMQRPVREQDEVVTAFRDGTVTLRSNRRMEGYTFSNKEIGYQGIRVGDLIVHAMDGFAGAIGISDSDGKATPVYSVLRPHDPQHTYPPFYAYLLRFLAISGFVTSLARGIRERSTEFRYKEIKELWLPTPPFSEQQAIGRFLDHKTSEIDALIAAKERLITLLQEKRAALITHAVTKGLDPSVPMKDSGIEWLGEIPAHWEVKKGRYIGTLYGSQSPDGLVASEEGLVLFIKVNDLNLPGDGLYLNNSLERYNPPSELLRRLPQELLLFPKRGAAIFTNKVRIVNRPVLFDSNVMGWAVYDENEPRFVAYALLSRGLADLADVSSVPQINNKHIYPARFPAPSLFEQRAIADFLDQANVEIDALVVKIEDGIDRLQEYCTALISSAVTGKIDVRNAT